MTLRNIKGTLPDVSGGFYTGPITFTPEKVPSSVVQKVITVEPDSEGVFDFNLSSGVYVARLVGEVKKVSVPSVGPSSITDIFVSQDTPVTKSEYESLKDLVTFCITNRIVLGDDGKFYSLSIKSGEVVVEVYEK